MEHQQSTHECHRQEDIQQQQDIHDEETQLRTEIESSQHNYYLYEAEETHEKESGHETDKIFVISPADTCPDPWTMVIESLHTYVAFIAMRGPRWAIKQTSTTKFDPKVMSFDGHTVYFCYVSHHAVLVSLVQRNPPECFVLIRREYFWYHARICKTEDQQKDLNYYVEKDSDDYQTDWRFEGGDDVEKECCSPEQNVSACIFARFRHHKPVVLIVLVIGHI